MDTKVKTLWLGALRSGDYEQGQGVLRCGEAYCCLGLLCVVAQFNPDWYRGLPDEDDMASIGLRSDPMVENVANVNGVFATEWKSGVSSVHPIIGYSTLSTLNDKYGYTFNQIADVIEAQL